MKGDKLICVKCGYGTDRPWIQRGELDPKCCPGCMSRAWQSKKAEVKK